MDLEAIRKHGIVSYLAKEKMAILSTHASDGSIDAMTVFFMADENLDFFFMTKVDTRKYQNMAANPHVSLTISNAETLETVEAKGTASVMTSPKDITDRMTSIINKGKYEGMPWAPPIAKLNAGQYVIIKVVPTWLRYGVFLNEFPKGEYFKQII